MHKHVVLLWNLLLWLNSWLLCDESCFGLALLDWSYLSNSNIATATNYIFVFHYKIRRYPIVFNPSFVMLLAADWGWYNIIRDWTRIFLDSWLRHKWRDFFRQRSAEVYDYLEIGRHNQVNVFWCYEGALRCYEGVLFCGNRKLICVFSGNVVHILVDSDAQKSERSGNITFKESGKLKFSIWLSRIT